MARPESSGLPNSAHGAAGTGWHWGRKSGRAGIWPSRPTGNALYLEGARRTITVLLLTPIDWSARRRVPMGTEGAFYEAGGLK